MQINQIIVKGKFNTAVPVPESWVSNQYDFYSNSLTIYRKSIHLALVKYQHFCLKQNKLYDLLVEYLQEALEREITNLNISIVNTHHSISHPHLSYRNALLHFFPALHKNCGPWLSFEIPEGNTFRKANFEQVKQAQLLQGLDFFAVQAKYEEILQEKPEICLRTCVKVQFNAQSKKASITVITSGWSKKVSEIIQFIETQVTEAWICQNPCK